MVLWIQLKVISFIRDKNIFSSDLTYHFCTYLSTAVDHHNFAQSPLFVGLQDVLLSLFQGLCVIGPNMRTLFLYSSQWTACVIGLSFASDPGDASVVV